MAEADDAMRERLAAALQDALRASDALHDALSTVDALVPVVHAIVADELRAAADEAHDEYSGWEAANVVRARADALDPR